MESPVSTYAIELKGTKEEVLQLLNHTGCVTERTKVLISHLSETKSRIPFSALLPTKDRIIGLSPRGELSSLLGHSVRHALKSVGHRFYKTSYKTNFRKFVFHTWRPGLVTRLHLACEQAHLRVTPASKCKAIRLEGFAAHFRAHGAPVLQFSPALQREPTRRLDCSLTLQYLQPRYKALSHQHGGSQREEAWELGIYAVTSRLFNRLSKPTL